MNIHRFFLTVWNFSEYNLYKRLYVNRANTILGHIRREAMYGVEIKRAMPCSRPSVPIMFTNGTLRRQNQTPKNGLTISLKDVIQ
jgi:hypothetical protein